MHKLEQGGILISNYREIVTKAVVAKGKKSFVSEHNVSLDRNLSTILGCWVINHNFSGKKVNNDIIIEGDYDVNIWYSYDNDRLTDVVRENNKYREVITMEEYKSLIGKLIIVEEEFKRNYNRKSYSYYSEDSYYIEEPVSGMSR